MNERHMISGSHLVLIWLGSCLAPAWAGPTRASAAATEKCLWKQYMVQSPATGKIERFWVGHARGLDRGRKHPAVYFLPGLLDGDTTWQSALDPHLAKHEVVAVCPAVGGATWFMNSPAQDWMKWGDFLTVELRAFVENNYPVSPRKGQRGIAGISAGGHGAFYQALTKPSLYGSVSVLSGSMDLRAYAGNFGLDFWVGPRAPAAAQRYADRSCTVLAAKHNGPLPFALAMEVGDKDGALGQMQAFRRVLSAKGIPHQWNVGRGAHNWTFWRSRAADVLAWHAKQFAANRRENRYPDEVPTPAVKLAILDRIPAIGLSKEAVARLRAPWTDDRALTPVKVAGIPAGGAPLRRGAKSKRHAEAPFSADLPARGHEAGLFVYRLTLSVATPLPAAGAVSLAGTLRNGLRHTVLRTAPAALPFPAGKPQRKLDVRARFAVELKPPHPIRGGIVVGIQAFNAAGKPVGEPVLGTARPGSMKLERWPVAPRARMLWAVSLPAKGGLALAAVHEARIEAEGDAN